MSNKCLRCPLEDPRFTLCLRQSWQEGLARHPGGRSGALLPIFNLHLLLADNRFLVQAEIVFTFEVCREIM
jgi:hypothetical protein